jgi:hypothetical protein
VRGFVGFVGSPYTRARHADDFLSSSSSLFFFCLGLGDVLTKLTKPGCVDRLRGARALSLYRRVRLSDAPHPEPLGRGAECPEGLA